MKRPSPPGQRCVSRLLPPLLLLLLQLPDAELGPRCPPAPPGRGMRLSLPRTPWASDHRPAWLPKRPSQKTGAPRLAQRQPGPADCLLPPREPSWPRLDTLQLGDGPPPWPAPMPALRRKRRATRLMRVGCALGTCQVQNLSHRLWQLKGQLGRQDSSPISPHSPHSYG